MQNNYTLGHFLASDISSTLSTTEVEDERVRMTVNRFILSYTVSVYEMNRLTSDTLLQMFLNTSLYC
jgi:hypothetical protein